MFSRHPFSTCIYTSKYHKNKKIANYSNVHSEMNVYKCQHKGHDFLPLHSPNEHHKTDIYKPVKAILFIMNCITLKAIGCN